MTSKVRRFTTAAVTAASVCGLGNAAAASAKPLPLRAALPFRVGFAKASLDPRPCVAGDTVDPCDLGPNFHLGGYGLGPTRVTGGPLVNPDGNAQHIYARAMAVSNRGGRTLLLADLENQGTFAAYKQGPYGLYDIRKAVSRRTGVPIDAIVINSDHSHAGPDMIGIWGGVPVSYLKYLAAQTERALVTAYEKRVPAQLLVGTNQPVMPTAAEGGYVTGTATPGEPFDHSQFGANTGPVTTLQSQGAPVPNPPAGAPNGSTGYRDDLVDKQLRVLQAIDRRGRRLGTLINYAAHATVMGGGNILYSADWPGTVAARTEAELGEPVAVTMPADVGRTQPPRPISDAKCSTAGHIDCNLDQLTTWTRLFEPWVIEAVKNAVPVHGNEIANREVFTREAVTNPALFGVSYSGETGLRGLGAYRSATPPWITGNVIGTFVSAHRIGDMLFTANPGEAYPDVRFGVLKQIKAPQTAFTFGLANDQVGYIIAPASEYGWITYSQPGNDNSFFNVSPGYGDHDMCTQTAAAEAIGFTALPGSPAPYEAGAVEPNCPTLTAGDTVPRGPTPQQPWALGDGTAVPTSPPSVP